MIELLLGLRLAMTALFMVILLHWARDPAGRALVDRLAYMAVALIAGANVVGWGPINFFALIGIRLPAPIEALFNLAAMLAMIAAAMLLIAVRGLRLGGDRRAIIKGAVANAALVAFCVGGAALLR